MKATVRLIYLCRTANMSRRTCVIVKQIQSNQPTVMTGVPLHLPEPSLFFTVASLRGWGASWKDHQISGLWSAPESLRHINWLELEAIRLALLQWGHQWQHQSVRVYCDNSTAVAYIRKQGGTRSQSLFYKTLELFDLLDQFVITLVPTHLPRARNVRADALSGISQPSPTKWRFPTETLNNQFCAFGTPLIDMFATAENRVTPIFVSPYPDDRAWAVDALSPIMGRFGTSLCVSSGSHCSQNSPENPKISGHHSHHDCITTSIQTVASTSSPVEHTSSNTSPGRQPVPVCAQPQMPSIPQRSQAIGSSRVELIRDVLKRHHFPDTVVDMAANPLRDSSSNVYNSHWTAFALWANNKDILPSDLSYITLAEYLVYLFSQNKKVNTILVHKASISSVLKLLNPPTAQQESTLHNVIRRMTILRPREQEVLPRWHLSVVLKGLMKPPFAINGTDRHISLELLSYKTAFLVALASGARGSELVALSRASHNLEFTTLASGVKQVSIRMVIPEPIKFPGIAHLFPNEPEPLLCPVRALGLYIVKSADRAQDDSLEKLFVHFNPATQLFTTHFRRWVAETIRLTYENSSESDLPKIKAHDVRGISESIAFYRNTPLKDLCGLISWKSSNVFVRHYLRDMAADTELQPSIWWPHGRLSRNLVSYLLITRHLHQCRLTLVVYQWQMGTIQKYNGIFPNRTLYLQNVPTCHSSASPGEWLHFGFPCLAIGIRNTKRVWSPGDSLIFTSCTFH